MSKRNHTAIADQFTKDVLSGAFPCGKLFRLAVERQAKDLAHPPAGYVFDAALANKACAFIEALPHHEGPKREQPFILEPWQVWLIRCLFGWVDPVSGFARFTQVTLFLPKGNGKSPLAARIALAVMARGKGGEKVYSAATSQDQARMVFDPAAEMVRLAPELRDHFGLVVGQHAIKGRGDNRIFKPVSAEAKSIEGIRPNVIIVDEIHCHPDRKLYDNLKTAANKVDGSRVIVISTAGSDQSPDAIGYQCYGIARDVILGKVDAPSHFVLLVEADRHLNPWNPATWRQANPNLGVSVSISGLKNAAEEARRVPSLQPAFFTKHLNWWVASANSWMDVSKWDAAADPSLDLADWKGRGMFVGFDFAPKLDITGKVLVGVEMNDKGERVYSVFTHGYLPEASPTVRDNPDLRVWAEQGYLTLTPGEVADMALLRTELKTDLDAHPGSELCADPHGMLNIGQDLTADGYTVVDIRQGWVTLSSPIKEIELALATGRLKHDGSPLMSWCVSNTVAKVDRHGNVTLDKSSEGKKIDLVDALADAIARAYVADLPSDLPLMVSMLTPGDRRQARY